jgi:hypothetical protein
MMLNDDDSLIIDTNAISSELCVYLLSSFKLSVFSPKNQKIKKPQITQNHPKSPKSPPKPPKSPPKTPKTPSKTPKKPSKSIKTPNIPPADPAHAAWHAPCHSHPELFTKQLEPQGTRVDRCWDREV